MSLSEKAKIMKAPTNLKEIEKFLNESTSEYEGYPNINDLRLQSYRTAFDAIMEELKTYRPVLAKIKSAYDSSLSEAKETRKELEETRQALLVLSEKCDHRLAENKQNQVQQLVNGKKHAEELRKEIKHYQQEKEDFVAQIDKLKYDLSETYKDFRDEQDARKILVAELRNQQAAEAGEAGVEKEVSDDSQNTHDPVKLALALEVCREDLLKMTNKLIRVEADYGDVVPKREFEILQAKHEKLEKSERKCRHDFEKLNTEHQTLLDLHKDLQQERDKYFDSTELLRQDATPRPNWDELKNSWPEGHQDWIQKTQDKTSADRVNLISSHFKDSESINTLQIRGTDESTPQHLRYDGSKNSNPDQTLLHNRNFDRVEISAWLDKIWASKNPDASFSETILDYFENTFNDSTSVTYEYTYSFDAGLHKFKEDAYINLARQILYNEVHESVKYRHDFVIATARTDLSAQSAEAKKKNLSVSSSDILSVIKSSFALKTEEELEAMKELLSEYETDYEAQKNEQSGGDEAETTDLGMYEGLFTQDEFGRRSPFLQLLVSQEENAKERYIQEISNGLDGYDEISFTDASFLLMNLDPTAGENVKLPLKVGFHVDTYSEAKNYEGTISVDKFIDGLHRAGIFRSGPKPN